MGKGRTCSYSSGLGGSLEGGGSSDGLSSCGCDSSGGRSGRAREAGRSVVAGARFLAAGYADAGECPFGAGAGAAWGGGGVC